MESELAWACAFAHSLLEMNAEQRFAELSIASALLDATTVHRANDGWRRLFGAELPAWASSAIETALRSDTTVHLRN